VLHAAGLGSLLGDPRHGASSGVRSLWGGAEPLDRNYCFGLPARGLNLDRPAFDAALAGHVETRGVRLRFGARLHRLERRAGGFAVAIAGPDGASRIDVDLVVDASGRSAAAARALGSTPERHDGLVGVAGTVVGVAPTDDPGRLHIEAAEDGWWYAVALAGRRLLACYMTDAATLRGRAGGALALWRGRLAASRLVAPLARGGSDPQRVAVFDAATQRLDRAAAEGFVAVGDAALAFDPLSSWGIAKAVESGSAGAGTLERAWRGDRAALHEHDRHQGVAFARYRQTRHDVYCAEGRWPASPFWAARRAAV
jgi:flavin-dependent dehydrogenase